MTGLRGADTDWRRALGLYLGWSALGHLTWEAAHMPLYTLAWEEPPLRIVAYGLHCVAGDVLIALSALVVAVFAAGDAGWPHRRFGPVAAAAIAIGVAYTLGSEWVNTQVLGSWTYTDAMPRLPGTAIGLTPVAQWLAVPGLAFLATRRRVSAGREVDPA